MDLDKITRKNFPGVEDDVVFEYTIHPPKQEVLEWKCHGIRVYSVLDFETPCSHKIFQASSEQRLQSQIADEIEDLFSECISAYYQSDSHRRNLRRRSNKSLSDETYEREERKAIQEFM